MELKEDVEMTISSPTASALDAVKLLVVDDTRLNRDLLQAIFESEGCRVTLADSGEAGLTAFESNHPDIVLLDLRMPGIDGVETLRRMRATGFKIPILILTSQHDVAAAVEATKLGADDFITRPIDNDELVVRVGLTLKHHKILDELEILRTKANEGYFIKRLITPSAAMSKVVYAIRQVAKSNFTVLILGETGTGKELVARALHQESDRADQPFVAVDCGALPETIIESELFGHEKGSFTGADSRKPGYFEAAARGTLFLDEIGNLPLGTQVKLLRVIQERELRPIGSSKSFPIDVRIIAATNKRLDLQSSNASNFRSDLYFRLAEFSINVPSLRERTEDISILSRGFMQEAALELRRSICSISPAALDILTSRAWPGNVRELRNVVRNAVLRCAGVVIEPEDLQTPLEEEPAADLQQVSLPMALRKIRNKALANVERSAISEAMRRTSGNKAAAARLLQVDVKTLYTKLRRYALTAPELPPESFKQGPAGS